MSIWKTGMEALSMTLVPFNAFLLLLLQCLGHEREMSCNSVCLAINGQYASKWPMVHYVSGVWVPPTDLPHPKGPRFHLIQESK